MVRRRKLSERLNNDKKNTELEIPSTELDKTETMIEIKSARIYKRWVLLSSIITLLFAWVLFPFFSNRTFIPVSNLSEFLLENSLHQFLPNGKFADEIIGNITSMLRPFWFKSEYGDSNSPGIILRNHGARVHFPVLLVPGIISTGLELWEGKECAKPYFRERFWGTLTMLRALIMDGPCWIEHMRLDPRTGRDPPGVRIRPAQGLEAADFLLPGFWVWARIIENLAEIGYDHNNMQMASYDWRLDIVSLEKRDHYLTKLKGQIEMLKKTNGKKLVIITHSLGACVWHYFMKWVESDVVDENVIGGNGGAHWVSDHIEAIVHIGGAFLGAPKSLSTFISGESRETAMLGKIETYFLEMFLSKSERISLFRTWSGGLGLLPKGGNLIWGGPENLAKDVACWNSTIPLVSCNSTIYYANDILKIISKYLPEKISEYGELFYSTSFAKSYNEVIENDRRYKTWMNPLESRLPNAPNMRVYCFHGIGKRTERAYAYKPIEFVENLDSIMDLDADKKELDLSKGVYRCEGDGTVPLLSLGYMGTKGWRKYEALNPGKSKIIVREYKDDPTVGRVTDVRGGPKSGDHVDILGNHELTIDLLKIVTNFNENETSETSNLLEDRFLSNIEEICNQIDLPILP